jgi:hypothetical protein
VIKTAIKALVFTYCINAFIMLDLIWFLYLLAEDEFELRILTVAQFLSFYALGRLYLYANS